MSPATWASWKPHRSKRRQPRRRNLPKKPHRSKKRQPRRRSPPKKLRPSKSGAELYDLEVDKPEQINLKKQMPELYEELRERHEQWQNEKLKTSMVGRPQEWWGVSNDVPPERFGPPKYDKATFKFDGGSKAIKVKLRR